MVVDDKRIVIGTRFFERDPSKVTVSLDRLNRFLTPPLNPDMQGTYVSQVLVAVNGDEDRSDVRSSSLIHQKFARPQKEGRLEIFNVTPWGKFVQPLNALLIKGRPKFAEGAYFLSVSVDVELNVEIVRKLLDHMDDQTLVVGAVTEGHDYRPGAMIIDADGFQVPWNNLALWNPRLLCRTGFLMLGESPLNQLVNGGDEEFSTITVQQELFGLDGAKAKLVQIPGVNMNKGSRAAVQQLNKFGRNGPVVHHI